MNLDALIENSCIILRLIDKHGTYSGEFFYQQLNNKIKNKFNLNR